MANAENIEEQGKKDGQPGGSQVRDYLQSLYKLVPTEISAAYLVIYSLLDPMGADTSTTQVWLVSTLILAVVVLLLINYAFFPVLRKFDSRDVRIFSSLTFLVWVLGTSVDLWTVLFEQAGLAVPHATFLVVVVLWGVFAFAFLRRIDPKVLDV